MPIVHIYSWPKIRKKVQFKQAKINVCDIFSLPLVQAKDKDRAKRKRRVVKPEEETTGLSKRKRRRRLKTDSTEISQYEEVVHSSSNQNQNSGSVIYEETVPMSESEQVC